MLCLPVTGIQKTSERCPRIWTDAGNTKRSLRKGGVETLSELAGYSKKEVLSVRSIGEKGLQEIREELARYGGHLTFRCLWLNTF